MNPGAPNVHATLQLHKQDMAIRNITASHAHWSGNSHSSRNNACCIKGGTVLIYLKRRKYEDTDRSCVKAQQSG
jgi:hypothetical protein